MPKKSAIFVPTRRIGAGAAPRFVSTIIEVEVEIIREFMGARSDLRHTTQQLADRCLSHRRRLSYGYRPRLTRKFAAICRKNTSIGFINSCAREKDPYPLVAQIARQCDLQVHHIVIDKFLAYAHVSCLV